MLSGKVMLVNSQCHRNSLNVRVNRYVGDTDCGNEMLIWRTYTRKLQRLARH